MLSEVGRLLTSVSRSPRVDAARTRFGFCVPALDVKVVPADTDRFGVGHGFNTSPSGGTPAAVTTSSERIRDKARLLAGVALEATPEELTWANGGWADGDGSDPNRVRTIEEIALYAHGTGALPPGVEGGLDAQAVYRD